MSIKYDLYQAKDYVLSLCFIFSSPNRGDTLDRNIDEENLRNKDFLILVSHYIYAGYFLNYVENGAVELVKWVLPSWILDLRSDFYPS